MNVNICDNVASILLDCTAHQSIIQNCNNCNGSNENITTFEHNAFSLDNVEIAATVTVSHVLSGTPPVSPVHNSRLTLVQPSTVDDNVTMILINTKAVFQ